MRQTVRSPLVWGAIGAAIVFFLLATFVPVGPLLEFLRTTQTISGLAVAVAFVGSALVIVRAGQADEGDHLVMGVALGWFATFLTGVWAMLWRLSGQPTWMYNSDFNALLVYLYVVSGVLHLSGINAVKGVVPTRNWVIIGVVCGISFAIAATIIVTRPSAKAIVDWLEPWVR
jgi:hypothetical protein